MLRPTGRRVASTPRGSPSCCDCSSASKARCCIPPAARGATSAANGARPHPTPGTTDPARSSLHVTHAFDEGIDAAQVQNLAGPIPDDPFIVLRSDLEEIAGGEVDL